MTDRTAFMSFVLFALFLALAPAALASNRWYVDGANGSDSNDCLSSLTACKTIGHAISMARQWDRISVAPATYTENLTISKNLKIVGADPATTIVDGGGVGTVFTISSNPRVILERLTIRNGYAENGGGINNLGILTIHKSIISGNSASYGGGIYSDNWLIINNSIISGNSAAIDGGGIYGSNILTVSNCTISGNNSASWGGGIEGNGPLTISNSTISGNSSVIGGGGIVSLSLATITNTTISGNTTTGSPGIGGGVYNSGRATINNSTISENLAVFTAIYNRFLTLTIQNSIVKNESGGGNCYGRQPIQSDGYNISSDNTCNFNGPGDMNNTDPLLVPLGTYGGPTQTMPLHSGSPAIDAGNPSGCTDGSGNLLTTDQRGRPRPDKASGVCDIGAVERQKD